MPNVLVTDGEERSTLAAVRSLGRAGFHVEVCAGRAGSLAGRSRHAVREHVIQGGVRSEQYADALTTLLRERSVDVLVPMTDASARIALGVRDRVPEVRVPLPPRETWEAVADKHRLLAVAGELGVPVPPQHVVEARDQEIDGATEWCRETGYPFYLKPHASAIAVGSTIHRPRLYRVTDEAELVQRLQEYRPEAFPILVQKAITGPGLGAFVLADEGRVVASFAHRRVREKPPTGGVSALSESIALREDLREHAEALVRHFRWSGVAMVEFKEDAASGTPYLMEINGRFWGSLQLAVDAGVDFPALLVRSALGEPVPAVSAYREGVRCRWLLGDLDHLLWILRAPAKVRADFPALPGRLVALARFLAPPVGRTRLQVLRLSDPRPFFAECRQWLRSVARRP